MKYSINDKHGMVGNHVRRVAVGDEMKFFIDYHITSSYVRA